MLPLSEYLATALVKGSAPQKITDLTAGTDYYAVALGMLTCLLYTSTYDLCIDSSVLGIDGTTGFVLEFVERKLGVKP